MSRYRSSITPPGFETAFTVGPDAPVGLGAQRNDGGAVVDYTEDENLQRDRMRARKAARIARYLTCVAEFSFGEVVTNAQDEGWRDHVARQATNKVASPHTWSMVIGFLEATTEEPF